MEGNIVQTKVCRPDDLAEEIREMLYDSPDHMCSKGDTIYFMSDQTVICIPDNPGRNELICVLTGRKNFSGSRPENAAEVYRKVFFEPDYHPDYSCLRSFGVQDNRMRCCILFRACSPPQKDLYSILTSMAPVESKDSVVPVDYLTTVFVKDFEGQSADEMKEFTEAVIGTLTEEGITDIRAGIGRGYKITEDLRQSYSEGKEALTLGIRYHRNENVYVFSEQTLERIVDSIPENQKHEILQTYFGSNCPDILSEELLETVHAFFQNDLNLTAASKKLYIHRNTLNYRLDKIKKEFGLDLRSFHDAVVFRIMTELMNKS